MKKIITLSLVMLLVLAVFVGCNQEEAKPVFVIGGIPDQNTSTLSERFEELATYLEEETGIETEYAPSADYAALVTAFGREEVQLGWFGGLTGVQARNLVAGSEAIAHRPRDEKFQSVFVADKTLGLTSLEDLKGHSLTFGSESSTSGHLMPRFFIMETGLNPDTDLDGNANYSGSHDKTWALVESGAFDAGALNIAVWESAVENKKVDLEKIDVFYTTPHYFDYNWTIGNVDEVYGEGTKEAFQKALLSFGADNPELMALFQDESFVETNNENYQAILDVAKALGIIE
jgi:phosphonate transport system substrate-binding protein